MGGTQLVIVDNPILSKPPECLLLLLSGSFLLMFWTTSSSYIHGIDLLTSTDYRHLPNAERCCRSSLVMSVFLIRLHNVRVLVWDTDPSVNRSMVNEEKIW
jgi:hypothetical protein